MTGMQKIMHKIVFSLSGTEVQKHVFNSCLILICHIALAGFFYLSESCWNDVGIILTLLTKI